VADGATGGQRNGRSLCLGLLETPPEVAYVGRLVGGVLRGGKASRLVALFPAPSSRWVSPMTHPPPRQFLEFGMGADIVTRRLVRQIAFFRTIGPELAAVTYTVLIADDRRRIILTHPVEIDLFSAVRFLRRTILRRPVGDIVHACGFLF
jgi:hypothetical protein